MTPERRNEDLRALWQTETSDTAHLSRAEIRRIVDEMERKMRRSRVDLIAAIVLVSVTIIAIAVLFPEPLLTVGAIVTVAGFGILTYEMSKQWRRAPIAENGGAPTVEYHRALLQYRLNFTESACGCVSCASRREACCFFSGSRRPGRTLRD